MLEVHWLSLLRLWKLIRWPQILAKIQCHQRIKSVEPWDHGRLQLPGRPELVCCGWFKDSFLYKQFDDLSWGLPLANPQVVGALTSGKAVGAAATASTGGWDSPNLLVCRNHADWLWEWFGYPMIFWWYWAYPNLPSTFWVDPLGEW